MHANGRHDRRTVWWELLRHARQSGIQGGSAFSSMAGFGRHHRVNIGASLPEFSSLGIEVEFLVTADQAREMLDWTGKKRIRLLYSLTPSEFDGDLEIHPRTAPPVSSESASQCLSFYVRESDRHGRIRLYRWLLMQALGHGLPGGTAMRTTAGFGRHGFFHDARVVDLAVNLAVRVDFLLSARQAEQFLGSVRELHPNIVFQLCPARIGTTIAGSEDRV